MAVAWVQSQIDTGVTGDGTTNPLTFNFLHTFTKGNTLVGFVFIEPAGNTVTSISDSQSNTYTILDTVLNTGFNTTTFVAVNIQNVPTSLKVTFSSVLSASDTAFVCLDELSGASKTDGHTGQHAASGTTVSSGNITTTQTDLLWGAALPDGPAPTVSAGSGFTLRINDTTNELFTETQANVSAGTNAATFGFSSADASDVFVVAFAPFPPVVSDESRGPVRRKRQSPLKQQDDWIQKQTLFQTTTPPIGFDEDQGARIRRPPFRAHTTPLEDTWIQKQTLFQTTTPPIGFDEDRGQQARRVPWRARPQPDYPEQQKVTLFQTFTPPIGFDEDRGRQIRRLWVAHPSPDDFVFVPPSPPIYFDEEQHFQRRRPSWRQHTQAVTDDWVLPPTTFVPLGFDEDRGRQIRRPWVAHPNVDDFIQFPTVFVPLGFDEDRGRQTRRLWVAHPSPDDFVFVPPSPPIYFDEEQHFQIRRLPWRQHTQAITDDWILPPVTFVPIGFDEDRGIQSRRLPWRATSAARFEDLIVIPPAIAAWGFDEEQHFQIRRTSWRQMSAIRREEAGDFTPMPPPPPKAHATGNVIFGVIRNLF